MERITIPINVTFEVDTHKQHDIASACLSLTRFVAESTALAALFNDNGFNELKLSVGQATRIIKDADIAEVRTFLEERLGLNALTAAVDRVTRDKTPFLHTPPRSLDEQLGWLMQQGMRWREIADRVAVAPPDNWI